MTLIGEPRTTPLLLRLGIALSERVTGRRMLPARLLAWYPRAAVGAGVLEALVAHDEPSERLLKLVRVAASLTPNCAFCIDRNGFDPESAGVSAAEVDALRAGDPSPFSASERLAIEYARRISSTPLVFPEDFMDALRAAYTERELVILASTAAQVNFWARLIQGLGIPPAGFGDACPAG